ncbi:MAG: sigma-70 family RNA polymerase sigma factor [Acidobacteria bacterium]|nr:sigma-70 family RNA polymerase sigma factor [Acidobacteriota bacterium]
MESTEVTQLLGRVTQGDKDSENRLLEVVYTELKRLATHAMRRERKDHTLQPSALVNEAYCRLAGTQRIPWENRRHFYATAAKLMRNILIDHSREHQAEKRGGPGHHKVEWSDDLLRVENSSATFLALDQALQRLAKIDARQAQIVELRFFGGLSVEETAATMNISDRTVKRDWMVARAWLEAELSRPAGEGHVVGA